MKQTVISVAIIVIAGLPAAPNRAFQGKPDLTGIWVSAPKEAPASLPVAPSAIMGTRFEIKHRGDSFTIVRPRGAFSIEGTYQLGGPEVRLRSPGTGCMGDAYFIEKAYWEGASVVFHALGVHAAGFPEPTKSDVRRFMRLEGPDTLLVEGTIAQEGQSKQVGSIYKRTTEALPPLATTLPSTKAAAGIGDVAWVSGTWQSDQSPAGGSTEERWTPPAGGAVIGISRTMRGPGMTAYE
jgi:hypothetical protein